MQAKVGETAAAAREDISRYFSALAKGYKREAARTGGRKAAVRAHPHLALMQELLAGEMASARRAFLFCAKPRASVAASPSQPAA